MKIYISIDMEGLWGVASGFQLQQGHPEHERGRKLMTEELNIVIKELFENGVKSVVVNDAHGGMYNVLIEDLDPRVSLISGNQKPLSMMEGIDETFDGAIFMGYHPRAMTEKGSFDHTYSGKTIQKVTVNGEVVGEFGLNARLAGYFDVPSILVTGDDVVCKQVLEEANRVATFAVKRTISRYSAEALPKTKLLEGYHKKIVSLFETKDWSVVKPSNPVIGTVSFKESVMMEDVLWLSDFKRLSSHEVEFQAKNYKEFYQKILAIIKLAR